MPKTSLKPTGTDWNRVKREAATDIDTPIDDQTEPYDPNNAAAVSAYWKAATITRGRGRPAVPVKRLILIPNKLVNNMISSTTLGDHHGQTCKRS